MQRPQHHRHRGTGRRRQVARDGRATKVVIETGQSDDSWEEVTLGLKVGDQIVVGPAKELRLLKANDALTAMKDKSTKGKDQDDEK